MVYLRRIEGKSLEPYYQTGQKLLCLRRRNLLQGQVALFAHEGREKLKIITALDGEKVFVEGTSDYSSDSHDFGWIDESDVKAVVVWPKPRKL